MRIKPQKKKNCFSLPPPLEEKGSSSDVSIADFLLLMYINNTKTFYNNLTNDITRENHLNEKYKISYP